MRTGPMITCRVPPAGFEPANAAFGGLRPFHLAAACARGSRGPTRTDNLRLNRRPRCHFATLIRDERRMERTCRPGPHRGASPGRRTSFRVPPGSRTRLTCLEGKVLAARTAVHLCRERAPGFEPGPSDWQSGMQPQTPCARGAPRRTCTGMGRGCSSPPISSVQRSKEAEETARIERARP